jgi:acyl phosphate:glycerol-3-phosphate acyltransferase
MNLNFLYCLAGAYILGTLNTSFYLIKWKTKKDIRSEFTGTAGATNASRILGKKTFFIVFLIDFAKGLIVAAIPHFLEYPTYISALSVLFVAIGHVYPIQLNFQGGKGLAVVTGGFYFLDPWIGLVGSIILALSVKITKKKTLSTVGLFTAIGVLYHNRHADIIESLAVFLSCCLIIWCHRSDLKAKKG